MVQALGVFLIAWLVVTLIFTVASLGTNAVTLLAFGLLNVTIVLLIAAYLGASSAGVPASAALHGAGWAEIVLAGVAFYIVLAELANETLQRPVFPLFPLRRPARPPRSRPEVTGDSHASTHSDHPDGAGRGRAHPRRRLRGEHRAARQHRAAR